MVPDRSIRRMSFMTAKPAARADSVLLKWVPRTKRRRPSLSSMARSLTAEIWSSTKPGRVKTAAAAAEAAAVTAVAVTAVAVTAAETVAAVAAIAAEAAAMAAAE